MRALAVLVLSLASAHAGADNTVATQSEPERLVAEWLAAQNRGDFDAYQKLYANGFHGVRRSGTRTVELDRAGWIADRQRMFQKPMTVSADSIDVERRSNGFRVTLLQTFASGRYHDVGRKQLELIRQDGALRIVREEQLESVGAPAQASGAQYVLLLVPDAKAALDGAKTFMSAIEKQIVLGDFPQPVDREEVPSLAPGQQAIAFGLCDGAELPPAVAVFRMFDTRVTTRAAAKGKSGRCPAPVQHEDPDGGWSWPVTAASGRLQVGVFKRSESERGDFAREYLEDHVVATLHDAAGALVDVATLDSESDWARFQDVTTDGGAIVVRERWADSPCNGADRHTQKVFDRTWRIRVANGKIDSKSSDRLVEKQRCSDDEARAIGGH
jgi:hypothetical protein